MEWLLEIRRRGRQGKRSPQAQAALRSDRAGLPAHDPGPRNVIDANLDWFCRAQDHSMSGIARRCR